MTKPEFKVEDAIRGMTFAMLKLFDDGYRSRIVDFDDLSEVLL